MGERNDWKISWKKWKRSFPWQKRLLFWFGGYPPEFQPLSEKDWAEWKNRFNGPEYQWKRPE
jgi:hypothetical protein